MVGSDLGDPVLVAGGDLDGITAGLTYEVMVMVVRLTAGAEEALTGLCDDVGLSFGGEGVELPVDGGEPDPMAVRMESAMQVLSREEPRRFRQGLSDGILLCGVADGRALFWHRGRPSGAVGSVLRNIITLQSVYMSG